MTLAISILGLVLAASTFVWQWRTWLYEGYKLHVTCSSAVATNAESSELFRMITVVNIGRSPVELTGWGFELAGGQSTLIDQGSQAYRVPFTLNGGHQAFFTMRVDTLVDMIQVAGIDSRLVKPFVGIATKGRIYGKALELQ